MPLYEYWCPNCKRKFTVYLAAFDSPVPPCPQCGKNGLERRFSTFSMTRSYKDVYDGILGDSKLKKGMLHNEPQALAEWNKRMGGGEKPAPEYEEMVGRLEHGEMPKEITEKPKGKKPRKKSK
ncbi:MAG: zinc ribbon domain-containing protein [Dehalococcoidales bacterium]|nr:zinc ribbon domain-containing protein [Dehalococcoidales bacterium]